MIMASDYKAFYYPWSFIYIFLYLYVAKMIVQNSKSSKGAQPSLILAY
jgi:hypothetical protein